jgi:hypothetical protein
VSTDERGITAAEALAEQREIDAQVRGSDTELDCDELLEEQRATIEREIRVDELEHVADERDMRLDDREQRLADRERRTQLKELDLGEREQLADRREEALDQREVDETRRSGR